MNATLQMHVPARFYAWLLDQGAFEAWLRARLASDTERLARIQRVYVSRHPGVRRFEVLPGRRVPDLAELV